MHKHSVHVISVVKKRSRTQYNLHELSKEGPHTLFATSWGCWWKGFFFAPHLSDACHPSFFRFRTIYNVCTTYAWWWCWCRISSIKGTIVTKFITPRPPTPKKKSNPRMITVFHPWNIQVPMFANNKKPRMNSWLTSKTCDYHHFFSWRFSQ